MSTTPNTSTTNAQQQPLTIGALVRTRRLELNLTLDRVGERAGCSKSYLSAIENDRGAHPGPALIARLEEALALEPGSLRSVADLSVTPAGVRARLAKAEAESRAARRLVELVGTGQSQGGTADRSPLDEAYRSGEVGQLLQRLGASAGDQPEAVPLPLEVPLINKVAAGYPTEFTDLGYPARIADEYVRCPDLADPDAFAARVVGTSMQPDYREGDIVIFSPAREIRPGADCFVRLEPDSDTTFKRVFFEGEEGAERIRLQPLNPEFPPKLVDREQVAGLYAAVSVMRSIG